jgi:cytidine deaminase
MEIKKRLVNEACKIRKNSYCPYSNYPVSAALLSNSGKIFTGVNVENAVYPVGICAERSALVYAVSQGERDFPMIAVISNSKAYPCGLCRQALYEFNPEMLVIIGDAEGNIVHEIVLKELLPLGFSKDNLIT